MILIWFMLWLLLSVTFLIMLLTTFLNHRKNKNKTETKKFTTITASLFVLGFLAFIAMLGSTDLSSESYATSKIENNTKVASNYHTLKEKEKVLLEERKKEEALAKKESEEKKKQEEIKNKKLAEEKKKKEENEKKKKDEEKKKLAEEKAKKAASKKQELKAERNSVLKDAEKNLVTDETFLVAPIGLEKVTVAKFVDGDTTRFYYNGEDLSFRYLLIDTPETKHPRVGVQPFGPEASARTEELLSNANVIEVEHDIGEKTDKYDRHLAYIWADGIMVNEVLVREGLAEVTYIYPPNTRHLERLKEAERLAKEEGIGIWSLPSSFEDDTSNEENPTNGSNNNSNNSGGNSGTIDDSYRDNPDVIPEAPTSFQNCTEMRIWYPNGVGADHPAYAPKHDRDKDGWACEVN